MEHQEREGIKQELIGQGKIKVYQYWKQRDILSKWRILGQYPNSR